MTRLLARWRVFLGFVFAAIVAVAGDADAALAADRRRDRGDRRIDPPMGGRASREEQRGHAVRARIATRDIRCISDRR